VDSVHCRELLCACVGVALLKADAGMFSPGPALRGVELCSRPGPPKTKGPSPLIETGRLQVCSIGSSCSLD